MIIFVYKVNCSKLSIIKERGGEEEIDGKEEIKKNSRKENPFLQYYLSQDNSPELEGRALELHKIAEFIKIINTIKIWKEKEGNKNIEISILKYKLSGLEQNLFQENIIILNQVQTSSVNKELSKLSEFTKNQLLEDIIILRQELINQKLQENRLKYKLLEGLIFLKEELHRSKDDLSLIQTHLDDLEILLEELILLKEELHRSKDDLSLIQIHLDDLEIRRDRMEEYIHYLQTKNK